jgi:hypothetical protein
VLDVSTCHTPRPQYTLGELVQDVKAALLDSPKFFMYTNFVLMHKVSAVIACSVCKSVRAHCNMGVQGPLPVTCAAAYV